MSRKKLPTVLPDPVLTLRTWGLDPRLRYGMTPRKHGLSSAKMLRAMDAVQLLNAHTGLGLAAMLPGNTAEELMIMMVRMNRLTLELAERLMRATGKPYQRRVDATPLEPWMLEESEAEGDGGSQSQ